MNADFSIITPIHNTFSKAVVTNLIKLVYMFAKSLRAKMVP